MQKGKIVKILRDRHFGFIQISEAEANVFFHGSVCENFSGLKEGDLVEFDTEETQRGLQAKNLKLVKDGE